MKFHLVVMLASCLSEYRSPEDLKEYVAFCCVCNTCRACSLLVLHICMLTDLGATTLKAVGHSTIIVCRINWLYVAESIRISFHSKVFEILSYLQIIFLRVRVKRNNLSNWLLQGRAALFMR